VGGTSLPIFDRPEGERKRFVAKAEVHDESLAHSG
jgi:hypothetical protein